MLSNDQCELDLPPHIKSGLVHEMGNSHMTRYRMAQKGNRSLSNWDRRMELFPVGTEVNLADK